MIYISRDVRFFVSGALFVLAYSLSMAGVILDDWWHIAAGGICFVFGLAIRPGSYE